MDEKDHSTPKEPPSAQVPPPPEPLGEPSPTAGSAPVAPAVEDLITTSLECPWQSSPRLVNHPWMSIADWKKRVKKHLRMPRRQTTRLVFVGDSITEGWTETARDITKKAFGSLDPMFLGIGGDQTQNVLWRIHQGELSGLKPQAVVLLIGINNIWWGGFTPLETAKGIAAVASLVRASLPEAHLIVHGLFPAGRLPDDELRLKVQATNCHATSLLAQIPGLRFLDIGSVFLEPDGSIDPDVMHDFVHLTHEGYRLWAEALQETLSKAHIGS